MALFRPQFVKRFLAYTLLIVFVIVAVISLNNINNYSSSSSGQSDAKEEYIRLLERRLKAQTTTETVDVGDDNCAAKTKLAFAKTHKTGSSTLQNILFRVGVDRNLTFAMPPQKTWMFSFKEPFNSSLVLKGPWAKLEFDFFLFHSVWNYAEVKKVIPKATFVTLLRDPVDCFESNYVYMGLQRRYKMDINEFAEKKAKKGIKRHAGIIGKNQQLWDLGVAIDEMENRKVVKKKIDEFEKQFDLVLIVEQFEESLILLGEMMCWPLKDLTFLVQNKRIDSKRSNMTTETREILKKWLWADYLLYDRFKDILDRKIEAHGRSEISESALKLREMNVKIERECVVSRASNAKLEGDAKMALPIVSGYVTNEDRPWCSLFARSEPSFVKRLRNFQDLLVESRILRGLV